MDSLFKCLSILAELRSKRCGFENIRNVTEQCWTQLRQGEDVTKQQNVYYDNIKQQIDQQLNNLSTQFITEDPRIETCFLMLGIIHEIRGHLISARLTHITNQVEQLNINDITSDHQKEQQPLPPPDIISIQQAQMVESCVQCIIYTTVLGCVDQEAVCCIKTMLAQKRCLFASGPFMVVPEDDIQTILPTVLHQLSLIVKHEHLGVNVRREMTGEILCGLLQGSFSPLAIKMYPKNVAMHREDLEEIMSVYEPSEFLRHLLLIKGIAGMAQTKKSWLRRVCGLLLVRRYLCIPGGVASTIRAGLSICDVRDKNKCDAVANIISAASTNNLEEFYKSVGPQIVVLLRTENLSPETKTVVSLIVAQLAERSHKLTWEHLAEPLLCPLISTTVTNLDRDHADNTEISKCLRIVYDVFVLGAPPSPHHCSLLSAILCPLFAVSCLPPTCHFKTKARHIIIRYLTVSENPELAVKTLLILCGLLPDCDSLCPAVQSHLHYLPDASHGIKIDTYSSDMSSDSLPDCNSISTTIIQILEDVKNPEVTRKFYHKLAQHIDFTFLNEDQCKLCKKVGTDPCCLMTDEDKQDLELLSSRRVVFTVTLLEQLSQSEALTDELFSNLSVAVPFLIQLLEVCCQPCHDDDLKTTQTSLLLSLLMLVFCYINERVKIGKVSRFDWIGLKKLIPILNITDSKTIDDGCHFFIEQLRNLLLTHGVVTGTTTTHDADEAVTSTSHDADTVVTSNKNMNKKQPLKSNYIDSSSKSKPISPANDKTQPLKSNYIDSSSKSKPISPANDKTQPLKSNYIASSSNTNQISPAYDKTLPTSDNYLVNDKQHNAKDLLLKCHNTSELINTSTANIGYKEAMEDLCSPHLPIRGHALISLGNLIIQRDKETIKHQESLLSIFKHHIRDGDSYIYLAAIQGLSSLCQTHPKQILSILTSELNKSSQSVPDRLKLCEVLTRVTRQLGALLPSYSNILVNALLRGSADQDSLIRAACLSSLGDVCKLLHYSLGPIIHEVFMVLKMCITMDKTAEVRRAAAMVITMILQGVETDAIMVLKDILRDLYRSLKHTYSTDSDEVVRLHSQLSLEEIDGIMRKFLLPKLNLTKKIYVTEVPPTQQL